MAIEYRYHKNYPESIIVREFSGTLNVDDNIESWKYLLDNGLITPHIKGIISILLACELDQDMDSFRKNINFIKGSEALRNLKLAVVCSDPNIVVYPTMGEYYEPELKIRPFSSEEAAVHWIMFQ